MADEAVKKDKEAPKPIDLNDLSLQDELVDVNPDADAFAGPPPPDDGDHRVKLSLGPSKVTGGTIGKGEQKGKPWYQIELQGRIQPGDSFEGRIMFNRASTMIFNGTSEVIGVLKAIGEQVSARESVLDLLRRLKARLESEPECIMRTQWTAYCADCKAEYETNKSRGKKNGIMLRGQNRFPQEDNGKRRHQIECPICGTLLTARPEVVAYKSAPLA